MATDSEVKLGNDIYVFATPIMAAAFSKCLMKNSLSQCKVDFPPLAVRIFSDEQALDEEIYKVQPAPPKPEK